MLPCLHRDLKFRNWCYEGRFCGCVRSPRSQFVCACPRSRTRPLGAEPIILYFSTAVYIIVACVPAICLKLMSKQNYELGNT